MIVLAVDIGNSQTKLGFFEGSSIRARETFPTNPGQSIELCRRIIRTAIDSHAYGMKLEAIAVCSSAREAAECFLLALDPGDAEELVVLRDAAAFSLPIRYDSPADVGLDRLANALAARELYGRPAIVVDMGTATTFDVLGAEGGFVGGAISPGLGTGADALLCDAPHLPQVDVVAPAKSVATDTVRALQSGIVLGHAAMVDGMVARMTNEIGNKPVVISTGGWAAVVAPHSRTIDHMDETLTLHGVRLAWCLNRPGRPRPK